MRIRIIFLSTFFLIASVSFAQKTITAQEVIQKGQLEGSWVPMSALQSNYVVMQLWQFDGIYLMVYRDYNKDFEITRMHKVTLEKQVKVNSLTAGSSIKKALN